MKTTRKFMMNGKQYSSMMDIARELGLKRVYPRDFAKLGITEIVDDNNTSSTDSVTVNTPDVDTDVKPDAVVNDDVNVNDDTDVKSDEDKKEQKKSDEVKVDKRFTRKVGTPEQIKEVLREVSNMSITEFCNYIKHFKVESLEELANEAGVNNWSSMSNEPIRKMRLQMELKAHYFPNEKTPVKSSSIWKKVGLDELINLADKNNLSYKTSSDPKIQRMWVVVSLNNAGLTLQDLD